MKTIPHGTVTSPRGFLAGATHADIKSEEGALDLGILYSEVPCTAAAVFTSNQIKAAPILLCQQHLKNKRAQAIVVNSGCANACTGERGLKDAAEMAELAAKRLGLSSEEVLVASTGIIGNFLPMKLIRNSIEGIALSPEGGAELARAITTTDTFTKEIAVRLDRDGMVIGGIAKGAGMIHPNLATLLCFLATDAAVAPDFLKEALNKAVDASFNLITIDGDTSPNDTVILLANGLAGNEAIGGGWGGELEKELEKEFEKGLEEVCLFLAKSVVRDGEGATRVIEVAVEGALSVAAARLAARTVASSPLVKAALHGNSLNWGRILAALGRSGVKLVESRIDLYLDRLCLMKGGQPLPFDREEAKAIMGGAEVPIRLCLNLGNGTATAWGCDLSEEYVRINSGYTT